MTAKHVRGLSDVALHWTISDQRSVIDIQERAVCEGIMRCPKLGRYWDDLFLCVAEANRRAKRKAVA